VSALPGVREWRWHGGCNKTLRLTLCTHALELSPLIPPHPQTNKQTHHQQRYEVLDRLVQGLSGLFLALRRRPVIRYQRNSENARRLAESLYSLTYKQQVAVFDFGSHRASPVVLLLDRRDDPVTPLLTQWTYQVGLGGLGAPGGLCCACSTQQPSLSSPSHHDDTPSQPPTTTPNPTAGDDP